jgi:glycosyltransferase involved in cell wall biosynthesis
MQLGIVVPCYNEEAVLPETGRRLLQVLEGLQSAGTIADDSKIYFVDDGSRDQTWAIIETMAHSDPRVVGMKLSRNRGHQTALVAGLLTAQGDALISIDADLQDDVSLIGQMVEAHAKGYDIVYAVRRERTSDTAFKRTSAQAYYRLLRGLGVEVVYNHADYRLLSRRVVECLRQFGEINLFLRGLVPLIGFNATTLYYDRAHRFAGESKYPLRKMLLLALDGVTSFSAVPLRLIAMLGGAVCLLSFLLTLWVLWVRLFTDHAVPGWASSVIPMYFLGGVQILSIGVLGEYTAKMYMEVKHRPRYFIADITAPHNTVSGTDCHF